MSTAIHTRATLDDLMNVEGKAELIGGRVVDFMPTGFLRGLVAINIAFSLKERARALGVGVALGDNVGFAVPELTSGRESFSPDASYYAGPLPKNSMKFIQGPPTLAVEVRSECDYSPAAEGILAEKRADYFAAGTLVVWDVDPVAECIHVYRSDSPEMPTTYSRGQVAEADPAVPGWRPLIDEFFPAR
ncbi:MAG: hypothetical protein JWN86_4115 [Planctomycetota bacterium]|nr:hypothetical protein [Planctomycetota bacterium]